MSGPPAWLIFRCAADAPSVSMAGGPGFSLPATVVWSLAGGCELCGRRGREVSRMASVVSTPHRICDYCVAQATAIVEDQAVEVTRADRSVLLETPGLPEIAGALDALRELGPHADVIPVLVARVRGGRISGTLAEEVERDVEPVLR